MRVQDPNDEKLVFRAVQVSLFGNLLLFVIKTAALIRVHSLAIATDLGITVVGLTVSVVLYYSLKLARKPADFLHNYGYGKMENVCEALEGIVLIGIGAIMSFQAVMHVLHPSEISSPWLGFAFSLAGSAVNFIGAAWILSIAGKCKSPAVRAEGIHYQLEGVISFTVAVSFLLTIGFSFTPFKAWAIYLDPLATLAVSFLIAIPSFSLTKHAFIKLLDASIEESGKMEVIKQLAKYIDKCCEFKDIRSRNAGRVNFVELKLILPPGMSFPAARAIAASVEKDLCENIPDCVPAVSIIPCTENCPWHKDYEKNA